MMHTAELENIRDAAALSHDIVETYDAVVVGTGAGGATAAKELAEGGMRVAVLEEGGCHFEHRDLASQAIQRMYRDGGITATIGAPVIPVPLGRCFGGTTTVNSGTCFRTPEAVLARWRDEFGLQNMHPETLAPLFDRVEAEIGVAPAAFRVMSRPNVLVHEFLAGEGLSGAPLPRNAPECEGCGMCCYGCTSGAKKSMAVSYLPKALRAGAVVYVHARADRVLLDRYGASGVRAAALDDAGRPTGRTLTLRAPRVLVACGTLLTPALLKRSGIARGNRHLGRHLAIHPASKVVAEFDEEIKPWEGIPQAYGYDGLHDDGIMFEGITMPPDLGGAANPLSGHRLAHYIRNYRHMASYGFLISDTAEGRMVRLPFLGHRFLYSLTPTDVRRFQRAFAWLARLFLRHGAKRAWAMVVRRDNEFTCLEDVDRFERSPLRAADIECMAFHPLGTCRMAATPEQGVCGPDHEVFGAPGVYVCDGSAVPTALGVNPQETIMMLATHLAQRLLGKSLGPEAAQ